MVRYTCLFSASPCVRRALVWPWKIVCGKMWYTPVNPGDFPREDSELEGGGGYHLQRRRVGSTCCSKIAKPLKYNYECCRRWEKDWVCSHIVNLEILEIKIFDSDSAAFSQIIWWSSDHRRKFRGSDGAHGRPHLSMHRWGSPGNPRGIPGIWESGARWTSEPAPKTAIKAVSSICL